MAVDVLTGQGRGAAARAVLALLLSLAFAAACGGARRYQGHGVVEAVHAADGQLVIAHEDIPGYMPAMTMSFDATPEVLAAVHAGQQVDFTLEVTDRSFRIVRVTGTGEATLAPDRMRLGDELVTLEPAPAFRLVDQLGEPLGLADLAGKVVLLDFIYTRCPGPCPILTSTLVSVERKLSEAARAGSHFVSISLDPQWDTPGRLGEYARKRGVDLAHWSFLTGPPDQVQAVIERYGVGTGRREADGELVHLVVTFLIDPQGRIAKRYAGLEHGSDEIAHDIEALLSAS
jgi:protein SCO1